MVTVLSPVSILATRDWLEPMRLARATWVRLARWRDARTSSPRTSLISTRASSSAERPRKSLALPTVHPARSSRFLVSFFIGHFLRPAFDTGVAVSLLARRGHKGAESLAAVFCSIEGAHEEGHGR